MPKPTAFHEAFARALEGVSPRVVTLDEAGSTNDEARALARGGAPHGTVVVANVQRTGRGRLGRTWLAEPGVALLASWVARPDRLARDRWTLIPLLAGVAAAEAVRARARVEARLKWPNDLVVGERKLGGILTEAEPPAFAVVGLGLNVSQTSFSEELPATSVALEGGIRLDRADLLAHTLRRFDEALGDPDAALDRYVALSATLGQQVRLTREAGDVSGTAAAIEPNGSLRVRGPDGEVVVSAGEVVHLRPA